MASQVEPGSSKCRDLFLLSKEYTFLNHGSFGTVPKPVYQRYKTLLDEVEACPDVWFKRNKERLMMKSRDSLAPHLNCNPKDLVFVENASSGVHTGVLSASLKPGDGILVTNCSYRAIANTARRLSETAHDIRFHALNIKPPIESPDDVVQTYRQFLSTHPDIKAAIIDHITSPSTMLLPIKEIIKVCREFNVVSIIDGAHAIGQLRIDLKDINPDFYTSNLHKWMFCPRGCAFLYIRPELQNTAQSVLASNDHYKEYPARFFYQASRDYTPYCVVPEALEFQQYLGGMEKMVAYSSELCTWAAKMLSEKWAEPLFPIPDSMRVPNMALIRIPSSLQGKTNASLVDTLYDDYKIVCSSIEVTADELWLRISCNVYNTREDYYRLADAVSDLMNNPDKVKV